jgi:hypothetical protein
LGLAKVPQATIHNLIRMLNEFSGRLVNDPASAAKVPRDALNRAVQMFKELSLADVGPTLALRLSKQRNTAHKRAVEERIHYP